MENEILTPNEASKQHIELFEKSQAEFRNLHKDMESAIEACKEKNEELDRKLAEAETFKISAANLEKSAEAKKTEAENLLEGAANKMQEAKAEESRLAGIKSNLEKTDLALGKQREENQTRESELNERQKKIEMDEREVLHDRKKVERLIKDNKIKEELAKE